MAWCILCMNLNAGSSRIIAAVEFVGQSSVANSPSLKLPNSHSIRGESRRPVAPQQHEGGSCRAFELYNLKGSLRCRPAAGTAERHIGDNRQSQDSSPGHQITAKGPAPIALRGTRPVPMFRM